MSKIVLHVGTAKTGTTTIQKLLYEKKRSLEEAGVYCPIAGRLHPEMGGHHLLAWSILYPDKYDQSAWSLLLSELNCVDEDQYPLIVLSSENFSLLTPDNISLVHNYLEDFDVTILVYLRNQKDFMISLYKQFIKTGHYHDEFGCFARDYIDHCDYSLWLEGWISAFGINNLCVKAFDRAKQPPGLVSDFFSTVLSMSGQTEFIFTGNWKRHDGVSPSRRSIKILRFINKVEDKFSSRYVHTGTSILRRKLIWRTKLGHMLEELSGLIFIEDLYDVEDIAFLRDYLRAGDKKRFESFMLSEDRDLFDF
jgi:hypothetical protein